MALEDIDDLTEKGLNADGHVEDHKRIVRGLKSVKEEINYNFNSNIPTGLGWNSTLYSLSIGNKYSGLNNISINTKSPSSIFDSKSTARLNPGATYYVDIFGVTASDTNDGLTLTTAVKSISKAVQKANAGGVPTRIIVKNGVYPRNSNPWNGDGSFGPLTPQVDIAFLATNGRAVITTHNLITGHTIDSTYANCYSWTLASANRVVDIVSGGKKYEEFQKVTTAARCNITPNSWVIEGGKIYVNRKDGLAVSDINTRVYRPQVRAFRFDNPNCNIYIGSLEGNSGFDIEGGGFDGCISVDPTTTMTQDKVLCVENASFNYAGGIADTGARGVSVNSWKGLVYFKNCEASYAWTDGFNFHNGGANAVPAGAMLVLTENCTSFDVGRYGQQSCNAWTLHENVIGIDISSRFEESHGGAIRNIDDSKALLIGTKILNDHGDVFLGGGGSLPPSAVVANGNAKIWVDRIFIDMPSTAYGLFASGAGAKIYKKNIQDVKNPDTGDVSFY